VRQRRRRADAERSIAAILEAAVRVFGERPDASIEEVADAAGLTRPTVYAHYPSRQALFSAAVDRVTDEVVAAVDAADLDDKPPAAALQRFLVIGWQAVERYPLLLHTATMRVDPQKERDRHEPIQERLERLIGRGQQAGDFDRQLSPAWLAAVTIVLGHTAVEQMTAGRISEDEAVTAMSESVVRVLGIHSESEAGRGGPARRRSRTG
jgi:AcrR family transcriptional regulator